MNNVLCWCLTDPGVRHVWLGPGMRRVENGLSLDRLPTWATRAEAEKAAEALRKAIGVDVRPAPVKAA